MAAYHPGGRECRDTLSSYMLNITGAQCKPDETTVEGGAWYFLISAIRNVPLDRGSFFWPRCSDQAIAAMQVISVGTPGIFQTNFTLPI